MRKNSSKKIISAVLLTVFTLTDLGQAGQSWAFSVSGAPEARSAFQIDLPQELGTVQEINAGPGPAIIQIQTAHGNFEAQKNIQAILHFLKDKYLLPFRRFAKVPGSGYCYCL